MDTGSIRTGLVLGHCHKLDDELNPGKDGVRSREKEKDGYPIPGYANPGYEGAVAQTGVARDCDYCLEKQPFPG